MITKDLIQEQILELSATYNNILMMMGTGVGKSLAAIKIIETTEDNWNIVVAELNHIENWKQEFFTHGKGALLSRVKFFCYNSLHKYKDSTDNFIFDEAHHVFSEKRFPVLQEIKCRKSLYLSATLTRNQIDMLLSVNRDLYIYKFSVSKAIEEKILPTPEIFLMGVTLDDTQKVHKFSYNKLNHVMCTEKDYYERLSGRIEALKNRFFATQQEYDKVKWLSAGNRRKIFLANCKTKYAEKLLIKLSDKRLICFCNSILQANHLNPDLSIHSKLSREIINSRISDFNEGITDKIFAVGMLRESVNLKNIEAGIIIQLDNQEKSFVQMHGRSLRSLAPKQYILYVKATQDVTYVNTALEGTDKTLIKTIYI